MDGQLTLDEFLFPERFDREWYESQRATLGAYNASGLLDCEPASHSGNLFDTSRIDFLDLG